MLKLLTEESLFAVSAEMIRRGYSLYFPLSEKDSVDLVAHKNNSFLRVQIKATKPDNGSLRVKFRSTNNWEDKQYSSEDFDVLIAYDYTSKSAYWLEMSEFEGMSLVSLRLGNLSTPNQRLARNYLFF